MLEVFTDNKNKNFLRLWLAQLISQFGDRIDQLALIGLIAERSPGSAIGLAKLMAFTILPVFLVQPLAGVLVDRWDRRTTLFICDLIRGALVLTIPFIFIFNQSMIPIYIVVFFIFCFSRFYVPAKMSIIPDLVEPQYLLSANSLVTTTGMIAFCLGCALGGFIVDWWGARSGFIIDAFTFFISAIFIFSIRTPFKFKFNKSQILQRGKEIVVTIKKSIWVEMREGIIYLIRHKEIRFIMNMLFVLMASAGSIYVTIIVFIQKAFHSVTKDLGVLAVCLGVGLFSGALLYGKWGKRFAWYKTIFFCLLCGGFLLIIFAQVVGKNPNILTAMFLSFLLGIIVGPIFIAANTIVHLLSDDAMRGKVFSALEVVIHLAFLTAMLLSSWISTIVPPGAILTGVGLTVSVIALFGFWQIKNGTLALME